MKVWLIRKRKRRQPEPDKEMVVSDNSADEKEQLLMEIASLDDDFEAGNISEGEYRKIRAERKNRLIKAAYGMEAGQIE